MERLGKISAFQMFSVLLLSRIIALFTFMLPSASYLPSGDRIITTIPVIFIELIFTAIVIFCLKYCGSKSIISAASDISDIFGKLVSVAYALCFIWFAGIAVSRFELFISTVMFPNSELYLMTIILLSASFYASLKGIEAIGRASSILSVLLGASILFILITVSDEFEFTNLKPLLTQGITPILRFAFYISTRAVELITILITAPLVKGNIKRMTTSWVIFFGILTTLILIILAGVTGEYGDDQIFPLYTLTVIAKFGIFERLDDIMSGLWVLCGFIQVSFLIFLSCFSLRQSMKKAKKLPVCLVCTLGVFGVYLFSSQTVTSFSEIVASFMQDILFVVSAAALPLLITAINFIRKKKSA
ncbi:MAG: GerAB/ArcD/ProY family transporter [Clostridia bacterium]|nr:GerAB/ArcD/ProY family transporter [Clostridia bacterium]